jgi:hypothetical protein
VTFAGVSLLHCWLTWLTHQQFGWRVHSKINCDFRLKNAELKQRLYFQINKWVGWLAAERGGGELLQLRHASGRGAMRTRATAVLVAALHMCPSLLAAPFVKHTCPLTRAGHTGVWAFWLAGWVGGWVGGGPNRRCLHHDMLCTVGLVLVWCCARALHAAPHLICCPCIPLRLLPGSTCGCASAASCCWST